MVVKDTVSGVQKLCKSQAVWPWVLEAHFLINKMRMLTTLMPNDVVRI